MSLAAALPCNLPVKCRTSPEKRKGKGGRGDNPSSLSLFLSQEKKGKGRRGAPSLLHVSALFFSEGVLMLFGERERGKTQGVVTLPHGRQKKGRGKGRRGRRLQASFRGEKGGERVFR